MRRPSFKISLSKICMEWRDIRVLMEELTTLLLPIEQCWQSETSYSQDVENAFLNYVASESY